MSDTNEPRSGLLTREVTKTECPWLPVNLSAGTVVFEYRGQLYNAIAEGTAVTFHKDTGAVWVEVPRGSVLWL